MDIISWLETTYENGESIGDKLARLAAWNGGLKVRGWGCISFNEQFGQSGLDHEDAYWLMEVGNYFRGLCDASPAIECERAFKWLTDRTNKLLVALAPTPGGAEAR